MKIQTMVREVLEAVLPESAMLKVRKWHYLNKVRGLSVSVEPDLAIAVKLLSPGDVAVDAGANYGMYMRFFAEAVGPTGHVFTIEPIPSTHAVLSSNVAGLGFRHVTVINQAVSDTPGEVTMEVPTGAGGKNFFQAHIVKADGVQRAPAPGKFTVKSSPLDELVMGRGQVRLMKVDVEGHELPCLKGALKMLRRDSPALLIEVSGNPDGDGAAKQLFDLLGAEGYKPYASKGMSLALRTPGTRSVNYFFLKDDHLGRLRAAGIPVHG